MTSDVIINDNVPANSFLPLTKHWIIANGNLFVLTLKIIDVQENGNKEA